MNNKKKKQNDSFGDLSERLSEDIMKKLKDTSVTLKEAEKQKEENERQKRIQEKREREKNKSFEELLEESNLDWRNFKK
ncbi:YqkE family protein [Alkalihalobacillus sp. LMS39]|uniref:YqkE family protein n=1 Tax=Alkalihalobacillus sp. LMS39 TaxID=2924032 RepID=UPI001FB2C834|nr:YqkE family protein [Alkalihalobacillus sp. LMS39]UOE92268.1 YqkE family protein [Alkalihalobacillus sp. LMS39]